MRVLLIDPPGEFRGGLNTGLAYLAGAVRAAGHDVQVLDLNNRDLADTNATLLAVVRRWRPTVAGFSIMSTTYRTACRMAEEIRRLLPGVLLVMGGAQAHYERAQIFADCPAVDWVMLGECEERFPQALAQRASTAAVTVPGLLTRDQPQGDEDGMRLREIPVAGLPLPAYELLGVRRAVQIPLMTSRGCPYQCVFCNPYQGRHWRGRPLDDVFAELQMNIRKFSPASVLIEEPLFNMHPERVIEFCRRYRAAGLGLPWRCLSGLRADRVTEPMVLAMRDAGCAQVSIGIESLHPDVFPAANKGETLADIERAIMLCRRHGIDCLGSIIIGLPGDTFERTMYSFRRACELGIEKNTNFSQLYLYPGTQAYAWYQQHGRILTDYRAADQVFSKVKQIREMRICCETDDFPAHERLRAYETILWRMKRYPFPYGMPAWRRPLFIAANVWRFDRVASYPAHLGEIVFRAWRYVRERRYINSEQHHNLFTFMPLEEQFREQE